MQPDAQEGKDFTSSSCCHVAISYQHEKLSYTLGADLHGQAAVRLSAVELLWTFDSCELAPQRLRD